MKTLKLLPLFLIAFLFCGNVAVAQEEEEEEIIEEVESDEQDEPQTIVGVFTGIEDGMFVFTYKDEDGEETSVSFDNISADAKKAIDLTKKVFVGKKFEVTFTSENVPDEDDEEMLTNVKTIVAIKQL